MKLLYIALLIIGFMLMLSESENAISCIVGLLMVCIAGTKLNIFQNNLNL